MTKEYLLLKYESGLAVVAAGRTRRSRKLEVFAEAEDKDDLDRMYNEMMVGKASSEKYIKVKILE
ncbi:hypothetical protein GOV13_04465 [Candidatus Pacearchaeota archaeon]|nr:hypothetical protein [Candidatus Pacearchaeota archaeon]